MHIDRNKLLGVVFGQAIGDALGLGTEFMSQDEVARNYPDQLTLYSQIVRDRHRSRWKQGEWTDDTDMMLCIAKAMIADCGINLQTIAHHFKAWFKGHPQGIGRHTYNVLGFSDYEENPAKVAEMVWNMSGKQSAPNGALMRTSILGLWPGDVTAYAEGVCRLTHVDPRCVGSCVVVSKLINRLVWDGTEMSLDEMLALGKIYDERITSYLTAAIERSHITDLQLDDKQSMGYTLKTLSAAVWCLHHAKDFKDGLLAVVNAGGDADTNAAVACSVLGAKYGFENIPSYYVENIYNKELLINIADELYQVFDSLVS